MKLFRVCKCVLLVTCCLLIATIEKAQAIEPVASGTFWQLNAARLKTWSDAQLAAEVSVVKQAGMDTIIIHYTAVWNAQSQQYQTFFHGGDFPVFDNSENRHPLQAIFSAAEKQNVKIVLGDFLAPSDSRYTNTAKAMREWTSPKSQEFRRSLIQAFQNSPSFYGYYIPNEVYPSRIESNDDQLLWVKSTQKVAHFVRQLKPDLKIIHPIGLYPQWHFDDEGKRTLSAPSREFLQQFWQPWMQQIKDVDIWMTIDGIGTAMATPKNSDNAQQWLGEMAHDAGKEYWVDVENAVMNSKGYHSFTMDQLEKSLQIAAPHADKIVLFEHLLYMSPNSSRETARQLYKDYLAYLQKR
jgi:hypothetical protein